jgi:hypothetical protein
MTALYVDNGQTITTHSMLKTMGRCPKQTQYKYAERLKPRFAVARDKPLHRGTWLHKLLEEHYAGRDWRVIHGKLTNQFGELFDEERESLGDLPQECAAIMRSYLWHYGADKADPHHGWRIHDTELTLECKWPDGSGVYRCRLDFLAEDEFGLVIGDHKSHKTLPDRDFRLLDYQSALYIWCAWQNNIPVYGFVWNYIRTKTPTTPQLVYRGTPRERLSTRAIETDYPTFVRALRAYDLNPRDYRDELRYLKGQRWQQGAVQTSPFFRRDILEKDRLMVARVVKAAMRTRDRMHGYDWSDPTTVERTVDRSCLYMCRYKDLCTTELFGGNADNIRRQQFKVGDPLDYYQDQKETEELT